jgi:peptidoglycan/xylan/chitin deacetylase (PgdA/CDA1 family)
MRHMRPLLIVLLAVALHGPVASAAPSVALTERAHWPHSLDSPEAFDLASRAELAVFVDQLATSDARRAASRKRRSVELWKERTRRVLVENFARARGTCASSALLCAGAVPGNWEELVVASREGLATLPAELGPWYAEQRGFYAGYLGELLRLAGLFPGVTSEILPFNSSERLGLELPDRHFLLTFDDGPSPRGGQTDELTGMLRAEGLHAVFFLLGSRYEARREVASVARLQALYAGMCVASHGQEHRSHATWAGAEAEMERFHARLRESLPEGQARLTLFRPPYGQRTPEMLQALAREGMTNMLWNIDSQDWHRSVRGSQASGRVLSLMLLWRRGIILFHDVHPKAREALPRIWRETRGAGVRWVDCRQG